MKYVLITVKNVFKMEIKTKIFDTKDDAYKDMREALRNRLALEGAEEYIHMLDAGIEFLNMALHENDANIFQDCGKTYHHWKIIEVA